MLKSFKVSVLLINEGEAWSAQCLDYDIAAQGATFQKVMDSFEKTFLGQIALDIRSGREPLANIDCAPQEYFESVRINKWPQKKL